MKESQLALFMGMQFLILSHLTGLSGSTMFSVGNLIFAGVNFVRYLYLIYQERD